MNANQLAHVLLLSAIFLATASTAIGQTLEIEPSEAATDEAPNLEDSNQSNPQTPFDLGTLVLSGELIFREVQDSPTSAYVETGANLENREDDTFADVLNRAGGVTGAGETGIVIRGINDGGVGGAGAGQTVTVVIDGARISNFARSINDFSTWDIDQVEILRGPQSTQTGRNALAGAVVVRSNDPSYEREARIRLRYGNDDAAQAAFVVNQPLIDDRLAFRLSVDHNRTDGVTTNETLGLKDYDFQTSTTVKASLRWDPTENFSAILKFTHSTFDFPRSRNLVDFARFQTTGDRVENTGVFERSKSKSNSVNLRLRYAFSEVVSLESETTFLFSDSAFNDDFSTRPPFIPNTVRSGQSDFENVEQELRLRFEADRAQAVVGVFYTSTERDAFTLATGLPGNVGFRTIGLFGVDNYAIFGEIEYEVSPSLTLIAGARYDIEDNENQFQSILLNLTTGVPLIPVPFGRSSASYEAFLPKLALVYAVNDDTQLGFTFQQGYRAGGAGLNLLTGAPFTFDPEFTNNYEISFRSQAFDGRLGVNANVFFTEWTDQQLNVQIPGGAPGDTRVLNAGESQLWGGELEVRAQPVTRLNVYASLGYVQTEFTDFVFGGVQLAGNEFPNASEWSGSIGGRYDFDNGLWLAADVTYTGPSFADVQNTLRIPELVLVNAQVGFDRDNWSIIGYVNNIFDEEEPTRFFSGTTRAILTNPREFGVIVQASF